MTPVLAPGAGAGLEHVMPTPGHAAEPAGPPPNGFDVHEWGLVDVAADGSVEIAAGPGRPASSSPAFPPGVRKPVLYVHLGSALTEQRLAVTARLAAGTVLEHFPPGAVERGTVRWAALRATPTPCSGTALTALASRSAPASVCRAPDGYCELNDLPSYLTGDSACLELDGATTPLLFYRGSAPRLELPLAVGRERAGLSLRAREPRGDAPETVYWLAGNRADGRVRVASWPAGAPTLALSPPEDGVRLDAFRAQLDADLRAIGLTERERTAFLTAWVGELLGVEGPASARDRPAPRDRVLFWLSQAQANRVAELTVEPAPHRLRRAMLVRLTLP